jgi:hypothetical protein
MVLSRLPKPGGAMLTMAIGTGIEIPSRRPHPSPRRRAGAMRLRFAIDNAIIAHMFDNRTK